MSCVVRKGRQDDQGVPAGARSQVEPAEMTSAVVGRGASSPRRSAPDPYRR